MKKVRFLIGCVILSIVSITYANVSQQQEKLQKHLICCPADSNSPQILSRPESQVLDKNLFTDLKTMNAGNLTLMDSGEPNIIEINSDITTNQIWTANNIYHINSLINVTALLVIEPGTVIYFAYQAGLTINNGGTLISKGTPDKPIIYTCDFMYPDYGYYFEYLEYYQWQYFYPAYIESTASPATTITYSFVEGAVEGIVINNITLDHPIENNHLFGNAYGIVEFGPKLTDIKNNLCFYNYYDGIYVKMSDANEIGDANTTITIENNTCDSYQDVGIMVHGASNESGAGQVMLVNNIVSGSYMYGLNLVSGYMNAVVASTGYYGNANNKNWEFEEYNPVVTTVNPFDAPGWHLIAGCPFIDAGVEYIEETPLIGMTTNVNGTPDSNNIDIGYHYPNWKYSNAGTTTLRADFDNNYKVDYKDLRFFANYWLFDYNEAQQVWLWDYDNSGKVDMPDLRVVSEYWLSPFDFFDFADFAKQWQKKVDERLYDERPDLNKDKIVNFKDFAILANEWQKTAKGYPAIGVSVSGDVNNLQGEIGLSVTGCRLSTRQVYILMDGQLMKQTDYMANEGNPGITMNTPSYINGSHTFKAVAIDNNDIIVSGVLAVNFNNPIHCMNLEDTYEPNQPLRLLGFSATGSNLKVKLSKWDGTAVWSQQTTGNLNINIPAGVLAGQIYDVSIEQEIIGLELLDRRSVDLNSSNFGLLTSSSWEPIWNKAIAAKYNPNDSYQFAIFLPTAYYSDLFPFYSSADSRRKAVAGIVNECNIMGIKYIILYENQCTWENFSRVLSKPSVIYAYVVSRGASRLDNKTAQRTYFKLTGGYVVSNLDSPLGGGWDGRSDVHSMAYLGLGNSYQLKMVWIDICLNGLYKDMANAWMTGLDEPGAKQLYVSWNGTIQTSNESCFCDWTAFFFGYPDPDSGFGHHGDNSYSGTFDDACRWDHVCDSAFISGKVQTYGDQSIIFTPNRYDY